MAVVKTAKVWLGGRKGITAPIRVSQYDTGWQFQLTVYDGDGIYVGSGGEIAVLNGKKANGAAFSVAGTFASGVATFDCPVTITEAVGVTECELRLTASGETVGTANFDMIVEKAPLSGYYASGEDFSAVAQLIDAMVSKVPEAAGDWLDEHITNPSNPPIDTSLSIPGAAADAAEVGKVRDTTEELETVGEVDLIPWSNLENAINKGVSYTWDAEKTELTVAGTATDTSYYALCQNTLAETEYRKLVPGESYYLSATLTGTGYNLVLYLYNTGSSFIRSYNLRQSLGRVFSIPATVVAGGTEQDVYFARIYVVVNSGVTPSAGATISNLHLYRRDPDEDRKIYRSVAAVQTQVSDYHGNLPYDNTEVYDYAPANTSDANQIGVRREYEEFTFNGTATAARILRVNGMPDRLGTPVSAADWGTGVPVIIGHTYRLSLIYLSGTWSGVTTPIVVSVYRPGESSTIGKMEPNSPLPSYSRIFVADTSTVNFAFYVYNGATLTDYKVRVLLEDLTEIPESEQAFFDLQVEDANTRERIGFTDTVNYGYDVPYNLISSGDTGKPSVWVWRRGVYCKIQAPETNTSNIRIKLNGEVVRTAGDDETAAATGDPITLIPDHRYAAKYIALGRSKTIDGLALSVYRTGEAATIGTATRSGNIYSRIFTAEENTTYNLFLYVKNRTAIPWVDVAVLLEDLGEESVQFKAEIEDTVSKAQAEITEPSLVFGLTTDIHRYSAGTEQNFEDTISNMAAVGARVRMDFIANLGDLVDGNRTKPVTTKQGVDSTELFHGLGVPYFFVAGNHDSNYEGSGRPNLYDLGEMFRAFYGATRSVVYDTNINGTGYYVDYEELNTRLVFLNTTSLQGSWPEYSAYDGVGTWLTSVLDPDKRILLFCHVSPYENQVPRNAKFSYYGQVQAAITAFRERGGSLIQINGHSHADMTFIEPHLCITHLQGKMTQINPSGDYYTVISGYIGEIEAPTRNEDDETKDAWSVFVYKPMSDDISMIRFGAGHDKHIHNAPISPQAVTTKLDGAVTWSSSDPSVATVSNGTISGVGSGRCAVLAIDADGNQEYWIVDVR